MQNDNISCFARKKTFSGGKSWLFFVLLVTLVFVIYPKYGRAVEIWVSASDADAPVLNAEAAILYSVTNDSILFEKNAAQPLEPASLTKLLTVLTAYANEGESIRYTVGNEIDLIGSNSSTAHLRKGNILSFEAIMDAVLLSSGNDATYTLAVSVARAVAKKSLTDTEALAYFAELMNESAAALGCEDSHFVTVDGYPNEAHYASASDLLRIAIEALNTPAIAKSMARSRAYHVFFSGREVMWENPNLLLKKDSPYYYPLATGMKTGSTGKKYSLAASAQKEDSLWIAIVLSASGDEVRFQDAITLFEAAWKQEE